MGLGYNFIFTMQLLQGRYFFSAFYPQDCVYYNSDILFINSITVHFIIMIINL